MGIDGDSMLLASLVLLSFDLFYISQDTHDVYVPLSTYLSSIVVVYTCHLILYLSQVSSKVGLGESEKKENQYEGRRKICNNKWCGVSERCLEYKGENLDSIGILRQQSAICADF